MGLAGRLPFPPGFVGMHESVVRQGLFKSIVKRLAPLGHVLVKANQGGVRKLQVAETFQRAPGVRRGKIIYNASSGKHCWNIDECGMHTCLGLYCDVKETARWIEKLMIEAWMKSSLFDATNLMNA